MIIWELNYSHLWGTDFSESIVWRVLKKLSFKSLLSVHILSKDYSLQKSTCSLIFAFHVSIIILLHFAKGYILLTPLKPKENILFYWDILFCGTNKDTDWDTSCLREFNKVWKTGRSVLGINKGATPYLSEACCILTASLLVFLIHLYMSVCIYLSIPQCTYVRIRFQKWDVCHGDSWTCLFE